LKKKPVQENYPEIIIELVERATPDELAHFNLSSFFSEKPLEVVFEEIDKTMTFFSVYVVMEHLEESLWEDSRYADKELVQLCSLVEEQARKYWMERNREHLAIIDKRMEELRKDPEYEDMKGGDLRDKVIEQLDKEVYPIAIERLKEEFQWTYADEWEEHLEKTDPYKERTEYRYRRRYDMPAPFNQWDGRNAWQQYYFGRDSGGRFHSEQGGSGGSGQRYNHGFYGHLFALLNSEKPVPTYFFTYDSRNRFIFDRAEKSLWLNFFDLIGNFQIDCEESRRILQNVGRIQGRLEES
jgi:hypothetical protein